MAGPPPQAAPSNPRNSAKAPPSPDDVVVVAAVRTPLTRAKKGGLSHAHPDELLVAVLRGVLDRTGVKPEEVDDVCFGSCLAPSSKRACEARQALFLAGFPPEVPVSTVNRQCAAGLQSIANMAACIRSGYINIAIAGGMEHMTSGALEWLGSDDPKVQLNKLASDCMIPMGLTSENVAEEFHIPRERQDAYAAASHAKAIAAQKAGKFRDEIVPVVLDYPDPESGESHHLVVEEDDTFRPDFTPEKLARLKAVFKRGGSTTIGNASQVTDGAAAVLLMRRSEAERRGIHIMATLKAFAAVGVPPSLMGVGPAFAIPKALEQAGVDKEEVDVYELNEAFGSQFAFCMEKLGLPDHKVNPNGGAIALGHPIGCTGARQVVTLLHEMERRTNGKPQQLGVVSMCTGSGMGAAAVFVKEQPSGGGGGQ